MPEMTNCFLSKRLNGKGPLHVQIMRMSDGSQRIAIFSSFKARGTSAAKMTRRFQDVGVWTTTIEERVCTYVLIHRTVAEEDLMETVEGSRVALQFLRWLRVRQQVRSSSDVTN